MMQMSRQEFVERLKKAADELEQEHDLPVRPEIMRSIAARHELTLGDDIDADPIARAIFMWAYCRDAHDAVMAGFEAAWQHYQQMQQSLH